jgi:predicted HicB family RNase H-like nuclease
MHTAYQKGLIMPKSKRETVRMSLRVSPELYDKLAEHAKENKRSLNQEVIWILEQYFRTKEQEEVDHESTAIKISSIPL